MLRDKIYAFANCAIEGLPGATTVLGSHSTMSFLTSGIVSVLDGVRLRMYSSDLKRVMEKFPDDDPSLYLIDPIDPNSIKLLVWSPLSDLVVRITTAKADNLDIWPHISSHVHSTFPEGGCFSMPTLTLHWKRLIELTKDVPRRVLVTYPPTHLKNQTSFKARVLEGNRLSTELCAKAGWITHSIRPELDPDGYWAHFSAAARREARDVILGEPGVEPRSY